MNFKKLIASLVTGCTLAGSVASPFCSIPVDPEVASINMAEAAEVSVIYGNVNNDQSVDVFDLTLIRREVLIPGSTSIDTVAADVNADGSVDNFDVAEVRDFILNKRKSFSAAQPANSAIKTTNEDTIKVVSNAPNALSLIASPVTPDGIEIKHDQYFYSPNGKYYLEFQKDGNLVINNEDLDILWSTGTAGSGNKCLMQFDGNLVIYDKDGNPLWHSHTNEKRNAKLYISNEGELCIYSADKGEYTFSSKGNLYKRNFYTLIADSSKKDVSLSGKLNYSPNNEYYVEFKDNGDLAVCNKNGKSVWHSDTAGSGKSCVMQKDGNLVIYNNDNEPVNHSHTNEMRNAKLYISDEGELCIYSADKDAITFSSHAIAVATDETIELKKEKIYYSPNKDYYVEFQRNGDLVVCNDDFDVIWNAGTAGFGDKCLMQKDGNLVIYDQDDKPLWHSHTNEMRNAMLYISDEGELSIYSADKGDYTFSTNTIAITSNQDIELERDRRYYSPNHEYYAIFSDGNLGVYNKDNVEKWAADIDSIGTKCVMKANGNLEIYHSDGSLAWDSKSSGMGRSTLYVSDTGRLCIYSNDKKCYTYLSKQKLSIPDEDISITTLSIPQFDFTSEEDSISVQYNSEEKKYETGFQKLGQNSLMMRKVDISTTVEVKNISEDEIRDKVRLFVQFTFNGQKGNDNKLLTKPDFLSIEKTKNLNEYIFTAKNVPCLGDEVNFGIKHNNINEVQNIVSVSNFQIKSSDDGFRKYDVNCTLGENLHIIMNYDCNESNIEKWLKTISRYINSLSDITGIKHKDIYIVEYADSLCETGSMNQWIIPSETITPSVLLPSERLKSDNWGKCFQHMQASINDCPNSIHLMYLHEISHCYSIGEKFSEIFGANLDDGNVNVRGITAMQNCKELNDTILYAETEAEDFSVENNSRGNYEVAIRNLADAKYGETVNFRSMNTFANYIENYGEDGWAILKKYYEGGDNAFNTNLFSNDVSDIIKNELRNSNRISSEDKYKCDTLCGETYHFMNTLQFLQQNSPYNDYYKPNEGLLSFIEKFVAKNVSDMNYNNAFVEYIERVEKNYREIEDKWDTGRYLLKYCVS